MHLLKGADDVVFPRLAALPADRRREEATRSHLLRFASHGLRTLVVAKRDLSEGEARAWLAAYEAAAACGGTQRAERLVAVADEVEARLELLGATAIEDRLQAGVPATISQLRRAGVKVWMLPGDCALAYTVHCTTL